MLSGSPDARVYVIMYGHQHRRSKISISVHVGLEKSFFFCDLKTFLSNVLSFHASKKEKSEPSTWMWEWKRKAVEKNFLNAWSSVIESDLHC